MRKNQVGEEGRMPTFENRRLRVLLVHHQNTASVKGDAVEHDVRGLDLPVAGQNPDLHIVERGI